MGAGIFRWASPSGSIPRPQPLPRDEPLKDYILFSNIVDGVGVLFAGVENEREKGERSFQFLVFGLPPVHAPYSVAFTPHLSFGQL